MNSFSKSFAIEMSTELCYIVKQQDSQSYSVCKAYQFQYKKLPFRAVLFIPRNNLQAQGFAQTYRKELFWYL